MEEIIKCTFCQLEQPDYKEFFRIHPTGVLTEKVFCDACLEERGGKATAQQWLIDVYVNKTKNLFDK